MIVQIFIAFAHWSRAVRNPYKRVGNTFWYNFRGLKSLNAAFVKLFCRDSRIQNVVGSKEIKALAVLRHLLVHKNGIIDRRFLEQCSEHPVVTDFAMFKEQQEVLINNEMVRSLVDPALRHGFELIRLVDDWMTDPPAAG